ncbi:uncharacterized protein [Onthophagus taurus]|uniref:uncharacterized protein n=1 Tax=Onthophagus taurus TaxID=166361 RepID=UPI0039BE1963
MAKSAAILVVCLFFIGGSFSEERLLGPTCGQHRCEIYNYCDRQTDHCEHCRKVCSPDHNFDQSKCLSECQVYFFDQRYYEKENESPDTISLINGLKVKFNVSIALIVILILGFIGLLIMILNQQKKISLKNIRAVFKKQDGNKSNGVGNNVQAEHNDKKLDLKIDIPDTTVKSDSPSTMTTGISRIPAEDSIVYAYDNPAMSNSPKTVSTVSP